MPVVPRADLVPESCSPIGRNESPLHSDEVPYRGGSKDPGSLGIAWSSECWGSSEFVRSVVVAHDAFHGSRRGYRLVADTPSRLR